MSAKLKDSIEMDEWRSLVEAAKNLKCFIRKEK